MIGMPFFAPFKQDFSPLAEFVKPGWSNIRVVRLAFNLYTLGMPSVEDYKNWGEQINECRGYSVGDIFCCSYAIYFWEGIKLRYPEYCRKQKSVEEILAEMDCKSERRSRQNDHDR